MKKTLILLFIGLYSISTFSQDTIYLKKNYKETDNENLFQYYRIVNPINKEDGLVSENIYHLNDKIKVERKFENYYSPDREMIENVVYYKNGQTHIKSEYKNSNLHGEFISYWPNGKMKRKDIYKRGKLKDGTCWNKKGEKVKYYDFEIQPEFPGGRKAFITYLQNNLTKISIPDNLKGSKAVVQFTIDEKGEVNDAIIKKSVQPQIDKAVIKIITEMPNWKPAKQDGNAVKVTRTIPLSF